MSNILNRSFLLLLLFTCTLSIGGEKLSQENLRTVCFEFYQQAECMRLINQLEQNRDIDSIANLATAYYYISQQTDHKSQDYFEKQSKINYQKALKQKPLDTELLLGSTLVNDEQYRIVTLNKILDIAPQKHLVYIFLAESYFRKKPQKLEQGFATLFKGYQTLEDDKKIYIAKRLYNYLKIYKKQTEAISFKQQFITDLKLPIANSHFDIAMKRIQDFCSDALLQMEFYDVCLNQLSIIKNGLTKFSSDNEIERLIQVLHQVYPKIKLNKAALNKIRHLVNMISLPKKPENYYLLRFLLAKENDKENWLILASQNESPFKAKATMWLCEFYFNKRKYQQAKEQCSTVVGLATEPWHMIAEDYLEVIRVTQH